MCTVGSLDVEIVTDYILLYFFYYHLETPENMGFFTGPRS
jgi:hypothetical protein